MIQIIERDKIEIFKGIYATLEDAVQIIDPKLHNKYASRLYSPTGSYATLSR